MKRSNVAMTISDPEQLLAIVNQALQAETRIDIDELSLRLTVDDGGLVLDGWVDNIKMKRVAANVASRAIKDGYPVHDHLRVRNVSVGELELRDEIVSILSAENMFSDHTISIEAGEHRETIHRGAPDACQIEVHVDAGTVTLKGWVKSLGHRRFAEVLIWWTAGCERVINMLEVVPEQEDNDNQITDVVRMVLEKDPLVHAAQLRVGTAAAVVEMRGLVASEEERDLALRDAWYVPGVWDVVDHIEVRP
jgi:osmotically-inducible protein OsmY